MDVAGDAPVEQFLNTHITSDTSHEASIYVRNFKYAVTQVTSLAIFDPKT